MKCLHEKKTLVNYELDYDASRPEEVLAPDTPTPMETCVAWQCDACGAFLDASEDVNVEELQRTDLPLVDYAAWDAAIEARLNRAEPQRTEVKTMTFLAGTVRR